MCLCIHEESVPSPFLRYQKLQIKPMVFKAHLSFKCDQSLAPVMCRVFLKPAEAMGGHAQPLWQK